MSENGESLKKENESLKIKIRHFFSGEFFHNSFVQWLIIANLFLNIVGWGTLIYSMRKFDFPVILHYNVYFGVDIIGNWREMCFLPATGISIVVLNAALAYLLYQEKQRIASYILLLGASFVQIGLIIALAGVILVNY